MASGGGHEVPEVPKVPEGPTEPHLGAEADVEGSREATRVGTTVGAPATLGTETGGRPTTLGAQGSA